MKSKKHHFLACMSRGEFQRLLHPVLMSFVMSNCEVSTFPLVSLVRCGA